MELNEIQRRFLCLDAKEARILKELGGAKSSSVLALSRRARIPRTSVGFLLQRMRKRGFTEHVRIANHFEWKRTDDALLADRIKGILNALQVPKGSLGTITGKEIAIEVLDQEDNVMALAKRILTFSEHDRVYYIQSLDSAKYQTETISKEFMEYYHRKIKKKKIIMETICSERILGIFKDLTIRELKSHYGRLLVAYSVPDQFIDFSADVLIYRDTVIIIDYKQDVMTHMKNALIASIFLNLFELIKMHSERIDLNKYIDRLIKKKGSDMMM